ncbi:MAG: transcriptional regulator [Nitrososphaeria archaeon]|nr:transcriptional regulator [Nitrososphaeria archaeon]NDB88973.1 transcriptional regulator [Nitrososphaerota archaeon]NDB91059.1 transcriptional regulator [Nitrososphaerota archaeon]NDB92851.1 transcriptional regulator [Nitrososphaeria archaeon]NDF25390.1 transcriptional regulator [Nitrososphaerota archaeon]
MSAKGAQNWPKSADKEQNRARIIRLLDSGPKRFTDLLNETKFSPRGLTTMLKDLEKAHRIEKTTLENGKEAYRATKSGESWLMKYIGIVSMANFLRDEGADYYEDRSSMHGFKYFYEMPWGIQDDMMVAKNLENPVTKETAAELQKLLYRLVKKDFKDKKIHLDTTKGGNILLGFMIDYSEFVESIQQNSLEYRESISEKELDILYKRENGDATKAEMEELAQLKQKILQKLEKKLK